MSKVKNGLVAAAGLVVGIVTLRAIRNRSGDSAEEMPEAEEVEESGEIVESEEAGASEEGGETVEATTEDTDELSDPEAVVRTEAEAAVEHLTAAAEHARAAGESAIEYARAELEESEPAATSTE